MNGSLQEIHRKGAVLMVVLTADIVVTSVIATVIGPRDWRLIPLWAGSRWPSGALSSWCDACGAANRNRPRSSFKTTGHEHD